MTADHETETTQMIKGGEEMQESEEVKRVKSKEGEEGSGCPTSRLFCEKWDPAPENPCHHHDDQVLMKFTVRSRESTFHFNFAPQN